MSLLARRLSVNTAAGGGGASYASTVSGDSPLAYWRLGESSGTNAADEMSLQDGTYTGSPTLGQTGAISDGDTAVTFSGSNYVAVPYQASWNTNAMSIECWMKTTGTGIMRTIDRDDGSGNRVWQFYKDASQYFSVILFYSSGAITLYQVQTDTINDGSFHHLVFTYDGSSGNAGVSMYIDGASKTVTPTNLVGSPGTTLATSGSLGIRLGDAFDTAAGLNGTLDEVAFYNLELTLTQVSDHYNAA